MALISAEHGFLFVMVPRTGCTALAYGVLVPHLGATRVPWENVLDAKGRIVVDSKHCTLKELFDHRLVTKEQARALFKFCAVRNPFDSLVSLYAKMRTTYRELESDPSSFVHRKPEALGDLRSAAAMDFNDWVIARYSRPASLRRPWRVAMRGSARPQHMYARYLEGMDHVMKFERLQQDLDDVLERLGISERYEIPPLNVTEGRPADYRTLYTDEARRIVERVFSPDIERFDYRF